MKTVSIVRLGMMLFIICQADLATASDKCFKIFGKKYTDGQTAYIDCTVNGLYITTEYTYESTWKPGVKGWSASTNFSYQSGQLGYDVTVTFDPTKNDGSLTARFWEGNETITIHITQRPTPTLTIAPNLCSSGQSGDFSTTLNYYGPSTANVVWETTGGVTVRGGTFYRVSDNTISRASIQHNSYGTLTVYGEIPGCNNMQTNPVTYYIGTPSTNQLILNSSPSFGGSICTGQYYYLQLANPLPVDQYSFSWNKLEGAENFLYSPSGPVCGITATGVNVPSYGIVELTVTNTACSNSSTISKDFYIENCNGSFRVMTNPASDKITTEFEPVSNVNYLPKSLKLSHERNGVVREIKLQEKYSKEAAKNGLRIELDVKDLPKDTYYLQGIYSDGKLQSKRIVIQ